jgi:2-haloalkanoic acid dehalogenase type II
MQQRYTPTKNYREILAAVYKRPATNGASPSRGRCGVWPFVGDWPFPDTPEALKYLKQHYKLVILSNVDNESFALSNRRLGVAFDAIYAAEDIGSYKPNLRNFEYMLENIQRLGLGKADILHTAESMFHDHAPANKMGLASAWIYRRHAEQFGATMSRRHAEV